jgi:DNA-binding transcriptional regulator YiaG
MTPLQFKAMRVKKRLTQTQLSKLLGVCQRTVLNWESGRTALPHKAVLFLKARATKG